MNSKYILDRHEPKKVDLMTWATWYETADRHVDQTTIDNVNVSTVFLGFDHRFGPEGRPILFETMIFGGKHDQKQWRYCTWDEAVAGHAAAVALVEDKQ